ncbi:MAG: glycosyltransferase family 4 protein [Candidatus Acidoferrales bacterium]
MKILYVSHLFLPQFSGGTEVLTYEVAREMQRRGHEVEVLTCEDWRASAPVSGRDEPYGGVPVHRLRLNASRSDDPMRAQYHFPAVEEYLRAWLGAKRPDLVHVHHFGNVTTAAATAAYALGIPVVFTATDFWLICPTSQLLRYDQSLCNGPTNLAKCAKCVATRYQRARPYRPLLSAVPEPVFNLAARLMAPALGGLLASARAVTSLVKRAEWNRQVAEKFSRFLVASRFMRERFAENRVPTERMELVGFGIDTRWAASLTSRRFEGPLRIGFIGAIAPHKGLHVLVEAFRRLKAGNQARLEVYGRLDFAPPYGERVQGQASGLEGIEFRGTFPHQEMGRVLSELDVLVVPSVWYENTPLVLHAAQAARLPLIVSDMGGLVEMVRDGENGLVVPAGDAEALAATLERCLREPGLLPRLSRQMPPVKTIEAYAEELLARYESVLAAA